MAKILAVIPARLHSTRLEKKLLKDIYGQSVIERVYRQAEAANCFDEIIIACDHQELANHCQEKDLPYSMTSDTHQSGTDRVAEVAKKSNYDIIVNIQGDEPFIEPETIQALVSLMQMDDVEIGTLKKKIKDSETLFDYNVVKVVSNNQEEALYFSRQAIPAQRDIPYKHWTNKASYYQHLGIYGFKKDTLLNITSLPQSYLEKTEKLEQLRWLDNGYMINIQEVISHSFGIDTEADFEKAKKFLR